VVNHPRKMTPWPASLSDVKVPSTGISSFTHRCSFYLNAGPLADEGIPA
jgi:hypothetical protein